MIQKMYLNIDGQQLVCDIVAHWSNDNNNYVAYTDPRDLKEKKELIVAKCVLENNELKLYDIEDDEEWSKVNDFLINNVFEVGDLDA